MGGCLFSSDINDEMDERWDLRLLSAVRMDGSELPEDAVGDWVALGDGVFCELDAI
jgi:hypothetical protein